MAYYLLRYEDNWADEMDLDGFVVLDEEEMYDFNIAMGILSNTDFYAEFCVGTNQEVIYDDYSSLLRAYEVVEIFESQYLTLNGLDLLSSGFASSFVDFVIEGAKEINKHENN